MTVKRLLLSVLALAACDDPTTRPKPAGCPPHAPFEAVTSSPEKDWFSNITFTRYVAKATDGSFYTRLGSSGCWERLAE